MEQKNEPFRIITFDGGGIRGAFTSQLLLRMVKEFGLDLTKVKLFAGTSTGSVIAAGLAMDLGIDKVAEFYTEEACKYVFSKKRFFGLNLTGPKYSRKPLENYLRSQYIDGITFDELPYGLSLTSFKLQSRITHNWLTVFFHNRQDFESHPRKEPFDYRKLPVLEAVLASGAAPTYFPAYEIPGRGSYIDGGVVANNPGVAGLSVATSLSNLDKAKVEDVRLLSVGNGMVKRQILDAPKWGLLEWGMPLMDILSDSSSDVDNYYCMSILDKKKGYWRLQQTLEKPVVLDDYKQVPYMAQLAKDYPPEELAAATAWFNAD